MTSTTTSLVQASERIEFFVRTSPEHFTILKSILYKALHLDNHRTVQLIPYDIQSITNKDICKTIIKKQNALIKDNSMISVYDTEERDIAKFTQLIGNSQYIQKIEPINDSKQ